MLTHPAPLLKPLLDCNLPDITSGSLLEFQAVYEDLAASEGLLTSEYGAHTHFALTGHYAKLGDNHRMKIQPQTLEIPAYRLAKHCDVDSAIGFVYEDDTFPLLPGHTVFHQVLNNFDYTLRATLHLPPCSIPPSGGQGDDTWIDHGHMPNASMAFISGANVQKIQIRYMFPSAVHYRQPGRGNTISHDRMAHFYDLGVRPSVLEVLPLTSHGDWPIDHQDEVFRATRSNGQIVYTPRSIPSTHMSAFLKALHKHVRASDELSWAVDFFLQIQIQGCKQGTKHQPPPPVSADIDAEASLETEDAFDQMRGGAVMDALHPLNALELVPDNWWIDIATTVHLSDRGYSLLISATQHDWLIGELTGESVVEAAARIRRGKASGYFLDETAHLGSVAGFRLRSEGNHPNPNGVTYIQAYTTEKSLTALKDGGYFAKHLEPKAIFRDYKQALNNHLMKLENVFREARGVAHSVDVRLESRVSYWDAYKAHRYISNNLLTSCLVMVKSKDFWQWKITRVEAIIAALSELHPKLPQVPAQKLGAPATLAIALCWLTNAMVNRPEQGSDFDVLADTISVHEERRSVLTPIRPLNACFLHSLINEPYLRISSHRCLDIAYIARLCGIKGGAPEGELRTLVLRQVRTLDALWGKPLPQWGDNPGSASGSQAVAKRPAGVGKVSRAKRLRLHVSADNEAVIGSDEEGVPEGQPVAGYASEEEDPEVAAVGIGYRESLESIFRRMAGEMMLKVPSNKQHGSWRLAGDGQCSQLTFKTLCDSKELPQLFTTWRQVSSVTQWNNTVEKLFPTPTQFLHVSTDRDGQPKGTYLQGLAQCSWFQSWTTLIGTVDAPKQDVDALVNFTRKKIHSQVQWLPLGKCDRLWAADGSARGVTVHGDSTGGRLGVIIVLNPVHCTNVDIPGGKL